MAGRLEPPPGALALAGGLVGVFRTVVQVPVLSVLDAREHVPLRSPRAFELIRADDSWDGGPPLEELAAALLGRVRVAPPLHQGVEDVAILIHGAPEVVAFTVERQKYFIERPLVARLGAPPAQLMGVCVSKLPTPVPHGFVRQGDTAFGHQRFDIARAE